MKHGKDDEMKIIIDADTYFNLKKYADKIGEPVSMVATGAINRFLKNMEW